MEVPFPLAASRRLMSFLTFQISIYRGITRQFAVGKLGVEGGVNLLISGNAGQKLTSRRGDARQRLTFFSASFA